MEDRRACTLVSLHQRPKGLGTVRSRIAGNELASSSSHVLGSCGVSCGSQGSAPQVRRLQRSMHGRSKEEEFVLMSERIVLSTAASAMSPRRHLCSTDTILLNSNNPNATR